MNDNWTSPPNGEQTGPSPRRREMVIKTALVGAGLTAGVILGASAFATAATNPTSSVVTTASSTGSSSSTTSSTSSTTSEANEHHGGQLDLSGTVTAVGSGTVTIKTSTGTTVYTANSSSDIDKNGESSVSALSVGDAVTFSVTSTGGTTIDKLHAGNEALDMPKDAPSSTTGG